MGQRILYQSARVRHTADVLEVFESEVFFGRRFSLDTQHAAAQDVDGQESRSASMSIRSQGFVKAVET